VFGSLKLKTLNVLSIQVTKKMRALVEWSILWCSLWPSLCNGELIDIVNYADRDIAKAFSPSSSPGEFKI
jgi:hypothetical protein